MNGPGFFDWLFCLVVYSWFHDSIRFFMTWLHIATAIAISASRCFHDSISNYDERNNLPDGVTPDPGPEPGTSASFSKLSVVIMKLTLCNFRERYRLVGRCDLRRDG